MYKHLASIFEEILVFSLTINKIESNRTHKSSKYFGDNLNFIFDDEYPEVQERSDFRYSRKRVILPVEKFKLDQKTPLAQNENCRFHYLFILIKHAAKC